MNLDGVCRGKINKKRISLKNISIDFYSCRTTLQKIPIKSMDIDVKKPIITLTLETPVSNASIGYINFSFKGSMQTSYTEAFFKTTYITDQEVER